MFAVHLKFPKASKRVKLEPVKTPPLPSTVTKRPKPALVTLQRTVGAAGPTASLRLLCPASWPIAGQPGPLTGVHAINTGVGVGLPLGVGVVEGDGVDAAVIGLAVSVGEGVEYGVAVPVGVGVAETVGLDVNVNACVGVQVGLGETLTLGDAVIVGVGLPDPPHEYTSTRLLFSSAT